MLGFNDIIGHEEIIRHLKNAIQTEKVSHSYIFTGDPGSGKKLLAGTYAMTLQCEEGGTEPCGHCDSCKKAIGKNHPDIIMVTHEKPNVITIDEIREQIINDVDIKPYCSPYKIYIVANAELMNPQAQNALLKTIEEPPEYAVIMLLTSNIDALLPTIRSRCVRLDLKVVDDGLVKKYLMEHLHIPDYQAEIDASYAHGSIGRAKQVATSQEFADMTQNALRILKNADGMEVYELTEAIKELSNDKQNISDYLDLFQFWFRDVLMFKATREVDNLVFKQEKEGKAEAEKLLTELGYPQEVIERVSYLVGHHHSYDQIEGMDYQILVEADFIVNMYEDAESEENCRKVCKRIFKTESGTRIFKEMFGI